MPELPEVEVLVRHLRPLLRNQHIRSVAVHRPRVVRPTIPARLRRALVGATFTGIQRRGKYLVFNLNRGRNPPIIQLLGHLGMTGRIYLQSQDVALPRHTAVVMDLDSQRFVFEDTRYFGRLTLDLSPLARLGPEPLSTNFSVSRLAIALQRSRQSIKVRLLDQSLVAGIGNIYASEALFHARINPLLPACKLNLKQVRTLHRSIKTILKSAVGWGSTVPLDWAGTGGRDRLFYYGRARAAADRHEERLRVYDRAGKPCRRCRTPIHQIAQGQRSTFFCPVCQS